MPTSDKQGKFIAKALIREADPFRVWDVGCGDGTYSDLARDVTSCHWVGIEIWRPYVEQFELHKKYNSVAQTDIREVDMSFCAIPSNSLIIFGDVLEHMPEDDARRVILRAKKSFRWILVSLPIVHAPQGEVNGNPYEAHLKHWTFDEMHEVMGKCMAFKGSTLGVFWWDSEEDV
jgi:hypothetical protein